MRNTALFFGSFNPIHVGHLVIAQAIANRADVDEVWLVPSPQNPLKEREGLMDDRQRLAMVRSAVADNPCIEVCDIEFHMPLPNYTYRTLEALAQRYTDRQFSLVIGSDNLAIFHRWKCYDYILDHFRLLVYPRPGTEQCSLASHAQVTLLDMPMIDISSTQIRNLMAQGRDVRYLVTEPVYRMLNNRQSVPLS